MRTFSLCLIALFTTFFTIQDSHAQKASSAPPYVKAVVSAAGEVTLTWGEPKYWEAGIPGGFNIYFKVPGTNYYSYGYTTIAALKTAVIPGLFRGKWTFRVASFGGVSGREGGSKDVGIAVP